MGEAVSGASSFVASSSFRASSGESACTYGAAGPEAAMLRGLSEPAALAGARPGPESPITQVRVVTSAMSRILGLLGLGAAEHRIHCLSLGMAERYRRNGRRCHDLLTSVRSHSIGSWNRTTSAPGPPAAAGPGCWSGRWSDGEVGPRGGRSTGFGADRFAVFRPSSFTHCSSADVGWDPSIGYP
jgi:hypothetical protein